MAGESSRLTESWRPVVGYEGLYEVSDEGNVRRMAGSPNCDKTRPVKARVWGPGYWMVQLWRENQHRLLFVHRLVAAAFLGDMPKPWEVNHLDGDKKNCRLTNLEWTTSSGNHWHGHRMGLMVYGERHYRAKLTADQVRAIRASEESSLMLSAKLGIGDSHIRAIRRREVWKYV